VIYARRGDRVREVSWDGERGKRYRRLGHGLKRSPLYPGLHGEALEGRPGLSDPLYAMPGTNPKYPAGLNYGPSGAAALAE
jgi:hypothetical protein